MSPMTIDEYYSEPLLTDGDPGWAMSDFIIVDRSRHTLEVYLKLNYVGLIDGDPGWTKSKQR